MTGMITGTILIILVIAAAWAVERWEARRG